MKLTITVEGRILASVPLDATNAENEYYQKAFRRLLTIRSRKALNSLKKEPVFLLDQGCDRPMIPVLTSQHN